MYSDVATANTAPDELGSWFSRLIDGAKNILSGGKPSIVVNVPPPVTAKPAPAPTATETATAFLTSPLGVATVLGGLYLITSRRSNPPRRGRSSRRR